MLGNLPIKAILRLTGGSKTPRRVGRQDTTGGIIVKGTMTSTVTDISTASMPNTYKAVFTIGYQYLGRGPIWNSARKRWEYQLSMTVFRTSDI